MSEEDRKLQKHLVDEMMKVSESNPDVMFYMEALMKKYEELEQKVEQLENIRKKAIGFTNSHFKEMVADEEAQALLNILSKGDNNGK